MSSAIVVYEKPDQVRSDLERIRAQVAEVLPGRVDPDRFLRVVAKAIIENPKLMACTRESLLAAVHEAAQLGLEPTGLLGSAYLVPYNVKMVLPDAKGRMVERKVLVARLIPGYRGLIDLARRSGEIDTIEADVVRQRDVFEYVKGTNARLDHIPFIPDPRDPPEDRDPGPIVGAYMKAVLRGGREQYEWMTYDQIEGVRQRSRAADDGPWVTDYSEMARKSVVRRGAKYLPLTTEFRRGLELDEEAERSAEPVTARITPSRAQQLLMDRSGLTPSVDTSGDGNGRLDSSTTGDDATKPLGVVIDAREAEGTEGPSSVEQAAEDAGVSTQEYVEQAHEQAEAMCGDESGGMGTCSRAPGHPGGHRNEAGVWPRARA